MKNTLEYLSEKQSYSVRLRQNLVDSIRKEDDTRAINSLLENTSAKDIPDMMQLMIETIKHLSK